MNLNIQTTDSTRIRKNQSVNWLPASDSTKLTMICVVFSPAGSSLRTVARNILVVGLRGRYDSVASAVAQRTRHPINAQCSRELSIKLHLLDCSHIYGWKSVHLVGSVAQWLGRRFRPADYLCPVTNLLWQVTILWVNCMLAMGLQTRQTQPSVPRGSANWVVIHVLAWITEWRRLKRQTRATCGCMAAHVEVRVCGLGLLPPRLNGGPVCDESSTEHGAYVVLYKWILPLHA